MEAAERAQHAPDHLKSQTVKLRKLVKEQRVHRPDRREQVYRERKSQWKNNKDIKTRFNIDMNSVYHSIIPMDKSTSSNYMLL